MRLEYPSEPALELTARGYQRIVRFGTLDFFWKAPDGRVLEESVALAELRKERDEEQER